MTFEENRNLCILAKYHMPCTLYLVVQLPSYLSTLRHSKGKIPGHTKPYQVIPRGEGRHKQGKSISHLGSSEVKG